MARWSSANVLQTTAGGRRLWMLAAQSGGFVVEKDATLLLGEACPVEVVGKDWHTLLRKKLNVAWLPPDKVFYRAIQLPGGDPAEMTPMVELQLEKISPLPVTQIVWSIYLTPKPPGAPADTLQTVLVLIASRSAVEEFLGTLEKENFTADRLEAPGLEQLLAADLTGDGVTLFLGAAGEPALAAWHYGGVVQNLTAIALPATPERGPILRTQLEQTAWAAELEGWLTGPLTLRALASADAAYWESVFKDWGDAFSIRAAAEPKQLAERGAARVANSTATSLLPPEFASRYQQQFQDRLWMRALMSAFAIYILGAFFYFGVLHVFEMKADSAHAGLVAQGPSYTNSLRDLEQIGILRTREALKYAALDCWKAAAESLPDSMTVENMYFQHGKFELRGTVVSESSQDVANYNEALRGATDPNRHEPLFSEVSPPILHLSSTKGEWSFNCTLKNPETE